MYHCHTPLWPLYASFHLCYACLFLSLSSSTPPPPPLSVCLSPLVFPVYWTETCWYEGPLARPQGNKSLVLLISCKIRHVHRFPPRVHSSDWSCSIVQAQTTKDAHPHMFSLLIIQARAHTQCRGPVVHVSALLTLGCLVCWTQGSESEMVCAISPFLPFFFFFFAFDSKMDDCNHRSHQWDRVEVYGAVRHSHGKPAFRLMQRAAMGTLCCLFVEGFCCFICIFLAPLPPPFAVFW